MFDLLREKLAGLIAPSLVEKRDLALRAANTDALTGLANRAAFDLARPKAESDKLAFILFDLNNFGRVNKEFGHAQGDEILKQFTAALSDVAAHYGARLFRLGGDEFIIIASRLFAPVIRDSVEARAKAVILSPSLWVSISGTVGETPEEADVTLQARKAERKSIPF